MFFIHFIWKYDLLVSEDLSLYKWAEMTCQDDFGSVSISGTESKKKKQNKACSLINFVQKRYMSKYW